MTPLFLQDSYLPTMPEYYILEARRALAASGGAFYGITQLNAVIYLSHCSIAGTSCNYFLFTTSQSVQEDIHTMWER